MSFRLSQFLFLLFISFSAIGQKYSIEGTLSNAKTQESIPFASIVLYGTKNDSIISGGLSDDKGKFILRDITKGKYDLEISFMGFESKRISSLAVGPNNVKLGRLQINPSTEILNEYEVVGEKEFMETEIDRRAYNVDKNIVSEGGDATDVLQNIPSVEVDMDGNVALRGLQGVRILIDGKPTAMDGISVSAMLEQIPSNAIEKIEVITNPSAKYDPDGMAGIINIVLKKSSLKGNYGGIRASIGTNDKYNGNINFNYRNDRVSVFANMNASHRRFENLGLVDRETFTTDTTFYLHQWKYGYNYRDVAGALVGLDWYVNDRNTLTLSFNGNRSQRMRLDNFENHFRDENNAARLFNDRNAINDHLGSNETYRIQYIKQFEDIKRNLFIDLVYMNAYDTGLYSTQEVFLYQDTSTLLDWINDYDHRLQRLVFQLDYEHPLPKDQTLEFGLKSINNQFNSDFIQYVRDPETKEYLENAILTNNFRFRESQNTAYGIYKKKYKNFGFQLGARLEQTITDNKVLQIDTIYNKNYFSLFPSGHISYALSDQEDLKFSYSKRINRPNFHALKPYADVSDPLNLRFGNPDLNPEFVDSYEIGHLKRWAKGITLTNSIYYKHVTDVIRSIRRVDSEGISTLTQENLNSSDSYGYEVIFSGQVIKWLRLNFSLNAFRTVFNGDNLVGDGVGQEGFGWNSNLGAFVKLQEDLQIQFNYKYVDPGAHSQGIILPRHMMELAVSKKILDKKGSIALRATDVFNTKIFRFNSRGPGYYHEGTFKWETQIAYASFSYKFGNQKLQKKKAKKKSTEQKIRKTGDEL